MSSSDDWTPGYLVDKIINNLMENGYDKTTKQNKYVIQIVEKYWLFRLKADKIFFEIYKQDLNKETTLLIEDYIQDCKTSLQKYLKLNGIMTEVIACISKQSEHIVISQHVDGDVEWIKRSINEIREVISLKWILIDGDG